MASASAGDVGRHLRQLFRAGSGVGLSDGQLLERFATAGRDSAEAAFETILARHGATVLSVCRQVLGDGHAAEDAFQATFLVLVRRADSLHVRDNGSLGAWLHGVAYRTALKARKGVMRRRAREKRAARPEAWTELAVAAMEQHDIGAALHAEVTRLPAKYRAPVVLCYFEGRTHDEAAAALDWPVGTVRSRLSRARDLLRTRLTRRGLAPAVAAIGAEWPVPAARAGVPSPLLRATLEAAVGGAPAVAGAQALAGLALRGLSAARLRMAAAAALGLVAMAAGLAYVVSVAMASPPEPRSPDTAAVTVTGDRAVAGARPRPARDARVPPRRRGRPGPVHSRRQDPGHGRSPSRHRHLGRGHGPAAAPDRPVGLPVRPGRPLARRHDPGNDGVPSRQPGSGSGTSPPAASGGGGTWRGIMLVVAPRSRPTAGP